MRFYSFLSLGLLVSPFGSCRPGLSQDFQRSAAATVVSDPQYLEDHGYSTWNVDNKDYLVLSKVYGGPGLRIMLKISVDREQNAVTIVENNLHEEIFRKERLELPLIFRGLCYKERLPCSEVKSIAMDIEDSFTRMDAENYREINGLGSAQQFEIAVEEPGWGIFSRDISYRYATEMLPGHKPAGVIVKQETRDSDDPEDAAVVAEVIVVLFN